MFEFVCQGGSGLYIKEFYEADWSVEWRFCAFYRVFHAAVQLGVVNDLVYEVFSISVGIRTFPGEWEYTFSYVFCSDMLQN